MPQAKRVALYLRVSTAEQTTENQDMALRSEAERRGWHVVATYEDAGISGAKGRDKRPGLNNLLRDATKGKFDVVMCWAMDRLGRSLADLISTLQELEHARVDLYLHQQAIDTTGPTGRLFFHILGSFAEFERELIRSRVRAGIARARNKGIKVGRPRLKPSVADSIRSALDSGDTMKAIASSHGVSLRTVANVKAGRATP